MSDFKQYLRESLRLTEQSDFSAAPIAAPTNTPDFSNTNQTLPGVGDGMMDIPHWWQGWQNMDPGLEIVPVGDGTYVIYHPVRGWVVVDSEGNIIDQGEGGVPEPENPTDTPLEHDYNGDGVENIQDIIDRLNAPPEGWSGEWDGGQYVYPSGEPGFIGRDMDGDGQIDIWYPIWDLPGGYDFNPSGIDDGGWYDVDGDGRPDDPNTYEDIPDDDPYGEAGFIEIDLDGDGIVDILVHPDGRIIPAGGAFGDPGDKK